MKRILLIICGYLSLFLGTIGMMVPLLPTTPFLLLSASCFMKSSNTLYQWITNHRIFGKYILGYRKYRAISKRSKIFTVAVLWISIITTAVFFVRISAVRIAILLIALTVTIHILSLKTMTPEMTSDIEENIRKRKGHLIDTDTPS